MTDAILFTKERHIGVITLNRAQAYNALNLPMIKALQHQLQLWEDSDDVHAVVIQAFPGKAFCAGGDVRSLYDLGRTKHAEQMRFFYHEYRLNHYIHSFPKPYIALMDGITMGGGVGISLHGSHPVASERFVFAMPETGIGFFPDIGASYLLSQCPNSWGTYLGLTGNRLTGREAYALGLVKAVIASDDVADIIPSLAELDLSKDAHAEVNACLESMAMPVSQERVLTAPVNSVFKEESVELMIAQLRAGDSPWHREALATLAQKAPLSLKVTLAQFQKAKGKTLTECLQMDYDLVGHFIEHSDFYEGIRAVLVDKDKSPRWQPDTLDAVSAADVARYFEPTTKECLF